jgi:hypothetical protein
MSASDIDAENGLEVGPGLLELPEVKRREP